MQVIMFILLVFFSVTLGDLIFRLVLGIVIDADTFTSVNLDDARITIAYMLFSQVFSFLVAFMFYLRISGEWFSDMVNMQAIKLKPLLITLGILLACFIALPLFELINEPLRQILPPGIVEREILMNERNTELFVQSDPIQFIFSLIVVALLPAIFEELVFRGFLIKKMLQSGMSDMGAILMSGAIFALTHMQPLKFLSMFVLGAALGFVYVRFKNLKYSMIMHFLFNGTQLTMAFLAGSGLPSIDL